MGTDKGQPLSRWVVGAVLVPILVALIGAGLFVAGRDGGAGSTDSASPKIVVPPARGGAEVRACMAQHQMSRARAVVRSTEATRSVPPPELAGTEEGEKDAVTVFKRCDWPPGPGADSDGYSEIKAVETFGPGESEASDANVADIIKSDCSVLKAHCLPYKAYRLVHADSLVQPMTVNCFRLVRLSW
jgi:hypothetical protein